MLQAVDLNFTLFFLKAPISAVQPVNQLVNRVAATLNIGSCVGAHNFFELGIKVLEWVSLSLTLFSRSQILILKYLGLRCLLLAQFTLANSFHSLVTSLTILTILGRL